MCARPILRVLLGASLAGLVLFGFWAARDPASCETPLPGREAGLSGCSGKPSPPVGALEARIVERPAPGRAVVEVTWRRGPRGEDPAVDLLLPEGARLVRGNRLHTLSRYAQDGVLRYEIAYDIEDGVPLDVVARLRAETGGRRSARETCVRLAE